MVFVPLSCSVIGVIAVDFHPYSIILCATFTAFFSPNFTNSFVAVGGQNSSLRLHLHNNDVVKNGKKKVICIFKKFNVRTGKTHLN